MQSKILPLVLTHLRKKYLITDSDVLAECIFTRRGIERFFECRMRIREFENFYICKWLELVAREDGDQLKDVSLVEKDIEEILDRVKAEISKSSIVRFVSCRKHKEATEKNLEEIQGLKEEILELDYAPGGRGALQAQKHFESLVKGE